MPESLPKIGRLWLAYTYASIRELQDKARNEDDVIIDLRTRKEIKANLTR